MRGVQVALEGFHSFPILEANQVVGLDRAGDRYRRVAWRLGGVRVAAAQDMPAKRIMDRFDQMGQLISRDLVAANIGRHDLGHVMGDIHSEFCFLLSLDVSAWGNIQRGPVGLRRNARAGYSPSGVIQK